MLLMATCTIATMTETKEDRKNEADQKQLVEFVEELNLRRRNAAQLQEEIDLFERYISQLDLRTFEAASDVQMATSPGRKAEDRSPDRQQLLTWEQKCNVAQSIHKQMTEDLKRVKNLSDKLLDNYKANLEEADIHLAEIKKESSSFENDIVKELKNKKSMTMSAEKVIRYIEDKIKAKDNLIEKFHQKNTALLTQKKKLQTQLRQQEEMAEGLTELDFELLKIANVTFRKQLDEQNLKHENLKLLAVKTLQSLNSNKEKLQTLTNESEMLSSDNALRMKLLVKIEEETMQAEEERNKAEALNRKLRGQLADFHVPHVLQYITVKETHDQLQKSVTEWERKVEIAEMTLKTYTKSWDKLRFAAGTRLDSTQRAAIGAGLYGL